MSRRVGILLSSTVTLALVSLGLGNWFFDFNHTYPNASADGVFLSLTLLVTIGLSEQERDYRQNAEKNGEPFASSLTVKLCIWVSALLLILIPLDLILGFRQAHPGLHSGFVILTLLFVGFAGIVKGGRLWVQNKDA